MGKITISADTLDELFELVDQLRGESDGAAAAPGEKPKRNSRKAKTEPAVAPEPAPVPASVPAVQATPADFAAASAQPAAPFAAPAATQAPTPFAAPFAAPDTAGPEATQVDRPTVAKVRNFLTQLMTAHGEPQVIAWVAKSLGLSPGVGKDEFMNVLIHNQSDEVLEKLYTVAGGK